ncbi:MAG: small subunit ribosomal protein S20 [Parcubacteria group bacterium Gr01-1014_13]|nr:MAG: small subunit ribosomal protein S20 [Parcubacteria group bacterium Gr01-1014_13]
MPNIQSARKELRKAKKRAALNKLRRENFKDSIKKAIKTPSADTIKAAQKALDKAAKAGVIKKNTASRRLSRLMKKLAKTTK